VSADEITRLGQVLSGLTVTGLLGLVIWALKKEVLVWGTIANARVLREREICDDKVKREREFADLERRDKNEWKAVAYKGLGLAEVGAELAKKAGS
jgi:hypothetical protein